MSKKLFIAEKPSVAAEFAKALKINGGRRNGFIESEQYVVTWCVGHLVKLSYPEVYDPSLKKWSMETIPFIPETYRYELISNVKSQFDIVASLLNRPDVDTIYVCTDSGREGEYIYRLVDMMAKVEGKEKRRVWIDSQTEEEILRGIREAKPESDYDNLAASAFLRAKEDYLMGINFSRVLTLKYGPAVARTVGERYVAISAGRVMTCVLGMVVRREREIRAFQKTSFYRVTGSFALPSSAEAGTLQAEWRAAEGSRYFASPKLYRDSGFLKEADAKELMASLGTEAKLLSISKKKETKNPPLLYNLAELQNDCAKRFKISPDQTLQIAQELYEKKLTTYPRTDARVLSTAVAKEIRKNVSGLTQLPQVAAFAGKVLAEEKQLSGIAKTRYVNDKAITDHYAIIPTGQGLANLRSLKPGSARVYELICRRFLAIFYPPAVYEKISLQLSVEAKAPAEEAASAELFAANFKALLERGYLEVTGGERSGASAKQEPASQEAGSTTTTKQQEQQDSGMDTQLAAAMMELRKGAVLRALQYDTKEGETSPPKRYTSGSMILAMENAGQLIEDEELRAQIKGSGIGTSATRAEILKKLFSIRYLKLNEKTQVITPTMFGELVNDVTALSIRQLLNPELTASWEKGLTYVAEGSVTEAEYMQKLTHFVAGRTQAVKAAGNTWEVERWLRRIPPLYQTGSSAAETAAGSKTAGSKTVSEKAESTKNTGAKDHGASVMDS